MQKSFIALVKSFQTIRLLGTLRTLLYIVFFVLSFRIVFIYLYFAPLKFSILSIPAVITIALVGLMMPKLAFLAFIAFVPLISGLQVMAGEFARFELVRSIPIFSFLFAILYMSWIIRRFAYEKKITFKETAAGNFADILSGIVILSLIYYLSQYPFHVSINMLQSIPFEGQDNIAWITQASYVLLQGLFLFRVIDLEFNKEILSKWGLRIFYLHAVVIIFFSAIQFYSNIPKSYREPLGLFSPFDDIHSYGGYVVLLFYFFAVLTSRSSNGQVRAINIVIALSLLAIVVMSYSRGTWLAFFSMAVVFLAAFFKKKSIIPISCIVLVLLFSNLFSETLLSSKNRLVNRFGTLMGVDTYEGDGNVRARLDLWEKGVKIMMDYPLTGIGIGNYYRISPYYSKPESKMKRNENAHNYFIQFGAELGLPALLLLISLLIAVYRQAISEITIKSLTEPMLISLLFGVSAYLVTLMTSHHLLLSNQQFLFWFAVSNTHVLSLQAKIDLDCEQ